MAYQLNEGQGSMFERKNATGKQPQYEGKLMVNGQEVRFVAWLKKGKNGLWYSLKVDDGRDTERIERGESYQDL